MARMVPRISSPMRILRRFSTPTTRSITTRVAQGYVLSDPNRNGLAKMVGKPVCIPPICMTTPMPLVPSILPATCQSSSARMDRASAGLSVLPPSCKPSYGKWGNLNPVIQSAFIASVLMTQSDLSRGRTRQLPISALPGPSIPRHCNLVPAPHRSCTGLRITKLRSQYVTARRVTNIYWSNTVHRFLI